MDILNKIAEKTGEFIFSHAWRYLVHEYGYLTSYRSKVENLEIEVQKLKEVEQHIVGDARRDHQQFKDWLSRVGDIIAHANKLINEDNEGHGEVRCLNIWPLPNVCLRLKLSKEAKTISQTVSGIIDEGRSLIASTQMTTSPFARDYEAMESRTSTLNEIKQALKDPNIYVIGVYGMAGAGKSTLVEELAWQVEKEGSFGIVLGAAVTDTPNFGAIQDNFADALDLKFDKETVEGRARKLRGRISSEKSILVILDDIWSELDLKKLGVVYGDDHKGCKLVLTSRDRNVLNNKMNTQINFALEVLSEEESWSLFEKMAGDVVKQHSIKPVAVEVAKCCAGLPLLIVTVAKGLRKYDVWAWKDSLSKLKKLDHKASFIEQAYDRLKFSYDCLESQELKSLFLLIGCFGQDAVNTEELFPICWGLGLYEVDTLAEARNRHYTLIDDLRSSSLLLGRETEQVKMHDLVHDLAKSIASGTLPTYAVKRKTKIEEWPKIDQLKKCHYIIVPDCYIHELPEKMDCPELKLLLLEHTKDGYLEVPHNFFSGMREVKVLQLGRMIFKKPLLQSLSHLVKLRSLKLSKIWESDVATVGELTSLEILIVESALNIFELPKELAHLTQLRMLNISYCPCLKLIPKNLLSSLKCLEELYLRGCSIEWEAEGRNNHNNMVSLGELRNLDQLTALYLEIEDGSIFPGDLHNFKKLERYKIVVGTGLGGGVPELLRTLELRDSSHTNFASNNWVKLLLTTVESLYLGKLECVRNIFPELNGDGFMKLRYLHVENSIELLHIINSSSERHDLNHAFPDLETLVLSNLENMEEICHGPLPAKSFDMLRVIKVQSCNRLKHLLLCSHIRHLSRPREMKISEYQSMTGIIAEEEIHEKEVVVLPKLHSLSLKGLPKLLSFCSMPSTDDTGLVPLALFDEKVSMPNLETMELSGINTCKIWDGNLPTTYSCIQNLTSLEVYRCNRLTSLFPSSVSRALPKLKYLEIRFCKNLEKIFVQEDISGEEVILPNLERLHLFNLDNLKLLWPSQLAPNSYCEMNAMKIRDCPKLLNVFPSYVLNNLPNLETLEVVNCDKLEVIFEIQEHSTVATNQQGPSTRLRELRLYTLPRLKYIWSKDPHGTLRFRSLFKVVVIGCGSLNHVFPISGAEGLQQLQVLSIRDSGIESIVEKSESDEIKYVYLEDLTLIGCHRLKNIVPSSVVFQNLQDLHVSYCHEVEAIFEIQKHSTVATNQQGLATRLRKLTLLELPKLKYIWSKDPHGILRFQGLCRVKVSHSGSLNHVFPISVAEGLQQLQELDIQYSQIENIVEKSESDEIKHINLERLTLVTCDRLKNIVPSSVVSQNLQELHVFNFDDVVNIMASSAATNLSKLRVLNISGCCNIEEIVASDHDDGDATREIAFMKLEELKLMDLLRLTSFCRGRNYSFKFPLLKTVLVKDCPMMETFCNGNLTAPRLSGVTIRGPTLRGEGRWDGDLNTTIANIFTNKEFVKMRLPLSEPGDEGSSSLLT